MIVRQWRARATQDNAPRYIDHARKRVLPQLAGISGHRGALVLQRDTGGQIDIVVLTLWDGMAAIKAFAGPSPESAVVEPEATAVLIDFDSAAQHYEVAASAGWSLLE